MFENFEGRLLTKKLTIHIQKRNSSKYFTIISGWSDGLDLIKICSYLKKHLQCGGHMAEDETFGKVIIFTGDHSQKVYNFLISENICGKEEIILKGI